ncbi:FG-GAP-like repeat-containing protein [Terricaulis sp.]|uniref:FG-GAP-like repeat-containing protein n=1 Tax=Terricaulis sp. TaxID=2768686 RepID=UPI003783188C
MGVWTPGPGPTAGDDTFNGDASDEGPIQGGDGNDTLSGGAGADTLDGGAGNDIVLPGDDSAADVLDGGADYDILSYANLLENGVALLGTGVARDYIGAANRDTFSNFEEFIGSNGGDYLEISSTPNATVVRGGGGDDFIVTADGDVVYGGSGRDFFWNDWNQSYTIGDFEVGVDVLYGGSIASMSIDGADTLLTMTGGGTVRIVGINSLTLAQWQAQNVSVGNSWAASATGDQTRDGGAGWDWMWGGNGDDTLNGLEGNDSLIGGAGVDSLNGGDGADRLEGGSENDTLNGDAGADVLDGGSGDDSLSGGSQDDTLTGGAGNDILDGDAGADTMSGGVGNDLYYVNDAGDVVIEAVGEGADTVITNLSTYVLADNVEELQLVGAGTINAGGNALANVISGGAGNDTLGLIGTAGGADTFNGLGGNDVIYLDGDDTAVGGLGDDEYHVTALGGTITEHGGQGVDTVIVSVGSSFTLGFSLENLTYTGGGDWTGNGNTDDNVITGAGGGDTLWGDDGNDTLNGAGGADTLDGGAGADAMAGGAGDDTYIVDNAGDAVTEAADEGTDAVQAAISYTLTANVENLTLTGSADINGTGNGAANTITGNSGANTLDGGAGADAMAGGAGDDTYVVDDAGDTVTEGASEGVDTVMSSVTYTLAANVENLTLTGVGDINGAGNSGANVLTGNSGANILDGGAGADTMIGGLGDDTYVVDDAGDIVTEAVGEGADTVQASISYALGADVENLVLTGAADINGAGNAAANTITGNSGANVLDGGAGADAMFGGAGDDTYVVDDAGDAVTEAADEGTDTVQAAISFTLGANVENLVLTGSADINGAGNSAANTITGNSGANVLDGGAGADAMSGGAGDDTYVVDDLGDVVTEATAEGTDTVQASISYTLGADVENLVLTGAADINGTGNGAANAITGNSGANVLDGGAGADSMSGGAGDDTYIVDDAGDAVTEAADEGVDGVQAFVSYTLSANVENLLLLGAGDINGTGNAAANTITGNGGANVLDGGAGADSMSGGAGDDTYVVDDAGDSVSEDVASGVDLVQASVTFTLSANVENLTLTGAADINGTGNAEANTITGNSGANVLDGGAGADAMAGGAGDDTYVVDDAGDAVTESADQGADTVQAAISYALTANVENLTLTGTADINGTGNSAANVMIGNSGANILDGGAGADSMSGGAGDDTYIVDDVGDAVTESAGQGTDAVQASISYTLGADVENLVLLGTADLNGTGNAAANAITGNSGANTIDGGAGADAMAGGAGDDTYVVDDAGDAVTEAADEGADTVQASISYTLAANVENLVLTGTADINGTGNAAANAITGNSGANILDGGAGADTLSGGAGDDTYVVDDAGDAVLENASEGVDTVQASVSVTLAANVENLVLLGDVNGTGNGDANTITGSGGTNIIHGGAGADVLTGGAGLDFVYGDQGDDTIIINGTADAQAGEAYGGGQGYDTLRVLGADVDFRTMSVGTMEALALQNSNVQLNAATVGAGFHLALAVDGMNAVNSIHLYRTTAGSTSLAGWTFQNWAAGSTITLEGSSGADTLTGSSQADALIGGDGDDTLNGGSGADSMAGGAGNDTYVVDNAGDTLSELAGEGADSVQASVSYTLSAEIENLTLTGVAALNATGNALANTITGNDGDNVIDGGAGGDAMTGGGGNDTYIVDSLGDVVTEALNGGVDSVQTELNNYVLAANVENLTLTGSAAINASGNALANMIAGNSGDNMLTGAAGNDLIDGGAGVDTAAYSVASSSASWVRNANGTWTVTAGADGVDTLSNVEVLHFADRDVYLDLAAHSFSGDGTSDIMFRRNDGVVATWNVNGTSISSASFLVTAGPEWTALGIGDFNGDGCADVLWQRTDGMVYEWQMNGGLQAASAITGLGSGWSYLGIGDFNGDNRDDVAWQRNDGIVFIWQMDGTSIAAANAVVGVGAEWDLAGIGDFNGDGQDDFLWHRGDTGQTVIWQMNGSSIESATALSTQPALNWNILGVGDVNGDGRDDIIMQRATDGMVRIYSMDGATVSSVENVATANPANWSFEGIGDYNGDGRDDILWQRSDGTVFVWLLDGSSIIGAGALAGVGGDWDVIGGG